MPRKRKNKAQRVGGREDEQAWFKAQRKRSRVRNKQAKKSHKENR